jgi:hypothetical protein
VQHAAPLEFFEEVIVSHVRRNNNKLLGNMLCLDVRAVNLALHKSETV